MPLSWNRKKRRVHAVKLEPEKRQFLPLFDFFRRDMEKLKLYYIDDEYIRFLQKQDAHVMNNKNRSRPYVGVVLFVNGYQYFVPLESPKPNHANIKNGKHILRIEGGRYGLMGFNNMIPVPTGALAPIDISRVPDRGYADLLRRQATFCNRNRDSIHGHASGTYNDVVSGRNKFLARICCDFKTLEEACDRYEPTQGRAGMGRERSCHE